MIVPMKKYTFLVYHAEYGYFLDKLREIGVVDVTEAGKASNAPIQEKYLQAARISDQIRMLKSRKTEPVSGELIPDAEIVMTEILELRTEHDRLNHYIAGLNKEIHQASPWGAFSPQIIAHIAKAGVQPRFFSCPERKFDPQWGEDFYIAEISRRQSVLYFVLFDDHTKKIDFDAEEHRIPEHPVSYFEKHRADALRKIKEINLRLDTLAATCIPALEKLKAKILSDMQYEQVMLNSERVAEESVVILNGFVPETGEAQLVNWLNQESYVYLTEKPVPDDNPPVLLKNNRFARLFEPIGSLFSLPSYSELDLTPFFAPFFMMFFGFCMGDLGYGLVLVLIGIFMRKRVSAAIKPYLTLAVYLGIATMIFGIITGTLAGFDMEKIGAFSGIHKLMLSDQQVFYLALVVGMVQILFGLAIQAYAKYRQFGFAYAVSPIGIILGVLAMLDIALLKKGGFVSEIAAYVSLGMIVFWSDPQLGIIGRLGKGVWDLYGIITGIFGDVLSYIRLFALGASSGILGFVINSISLPLIHSVPVLGPILFILVMVVGHGANMALAGLGSFVHPMRLTFVEFYKNAGFVGGGKKYKPFSKDQL